MGVFVEKEFRIKKGSGGDKVRSIKASKSAFNHKVKAGAKTSSGVRLPSREVTVKITGAGKTARGIKNGVDYITREGELEAHFYGGDDSVISGLGAEHNEMVSEALSDGNNYGLKNKTGEGVDHVKNFVFSPPPVAGVSEADAIASTKKALINRYPHNAFVMVYHDDKKDHPHVHVNLKLKSELDGKRIRLTKMEVREIRSQYCTELQKLGYDVRATQRHEYNIKDGIGEPKVGRNVFKVSDFGEASYQFKAGEKKTPFITYETASGKAVTIWGKELKEHFKVEQLAKGDLVKIKKLAATTVKTPIFDKAGAVSGYRESKRNNWQIENLKVDRVRDHIIKKEVVLEPSPEKIKMQLTNKASIEGDIKFAEEKGYLKGSEQHKKELKIGKGIILGG